MCGRCGAAFPTENLAELASHGGAACAKCGNFISVRATPEEFRRTVVPGVPFLVGEDPSQIPGASEGLAFQPKPASKPVTFSCPRCNGSLDVDGKERTITCSYCSSSIYLPDDLWHRLHPVSTVQRWYLQLDWFQGKERISALGASWKFCMGCGEPLNEARECPHCTIKRPSPDSDEPSGDPIALREYYTIMASLIPPVGLGLATYYLVRPERRWLGWRCLAMALFASVAAGFIVWGSH